MINIIIAGISNALFEEFGYKNHMEEIKQDLKEPCFFISCINPAFRRYLGTRYFQQNEFVIQYFPESKSNAKAECNAVAERMDWCLEVIQTDAGDIRGNNMNYKIVDGVLNYFINYDCFIYRVEQKNVMEQVKSNTKMKGE